MAMTVSVPAPTANGVPGIYSAESAKYALVIGDSAYPAGGYPVTPSAFTLYQQIQSVTPLALSTAPNTYQTLYDPARGTLRFYLLPNGANTAMNEVATGTNLSAVQLTVQVLGWAWLLGAFALVPALLRTIGIA